MTLKRRKCRRRPFVAQGALHSRVLQILVGEALRRNSWILTDEKHSSLEVSIPDETWLGQIERVVP